MTLNNIDPLKYTFFKALKAAVIIAFTATNPPEHPVMWGILLTLTLAVAVADGVLLDTPLATGAVIALALVICFTGTLPRFQNPAMFVLVCMEIISYIYIVLEDIRELFKEVDSPLEHSEEL